MDNVDARPAYRRRRAGPPIVDRFEIGRRPPAAPVSAGSARAFDGGMMDALAIPPAALRDTDALELARVWIAERGLHCSLKVGLYAGDGVSRETAAWGIILPDLAGHIADALSAEGMGSRADLLDALVESFNREAAEPSSRRTGGRGATVS